MTHQQQRRPITAWIVTCFTLLLLASWGLSACDPPVDALCGNGSSTSGTMVSSSEVNCGGGTLSEITDVKLYTCNGQEKTMLDIIGNHDVTYITFGALWCSACQKEVSIINAKIVDHFDSAKVGVMQILVEDNLGEAPTADVCQDWADSLKPEFPLLTDLDQGIGPLYFDNFEEQGIPTLPLHLIATRDGKIRYEVLGPMPDDLQNEIAKWIESP